MGSTALSKLPLGEDQAFRSVLKTLGRMLGKVGSVSHVSCIDRRVASAPGTAAGTEYTQLHQCGLDHLLGASALLGSVPARVMARSSRPSQRAAAHGAVSEVFLELANGQHVQYFGSLAASHAERTIWIEGPLGSLRAQGKWVWFRKRGWPRFVPWRWVANGARGGAADADAAHALLEAIVRSDQDGIVAEIRAATTDAPRSVTSELGS
jgi:hypothetical protein